MTLCSLCYRKRQESNFHLVFINARTLSFFSARDNAIKMRILCFSQGEDRFSISGERSHVFILCGELPHNPGKGSSKTAPASGRFASKSDFAANEIGLAVHPPREISFRAELATLVLQLERRVARHRRLSYFFRQWPRKGLNDRRAGKSSGIDLRLWTNCSAIFALRLKNTRCRIWKCYGKNIFSWCQTIDELVQFSFSKTSSNNRVWLNLRC